MGEFRSIEADTLIDQRIFHNVAKRPMHVMQEFVSL